MRISRPRRRGCRGGGQSTTLTADADERRPGRSQVGCARQGVVDSAPSADSTVSRHYRSRSGHETAGDPTQASLADSRRIGVFSETGRRHREPSSGPLDNEHDLAEGARFQDGFVRTWRVGERHLAADDRIERAVRRGRRRAPRESTRARAACTLNSVMPKIAASRPIV